MIKTLLRTHGVAMALALAAGVICWIPHAAWGERAPFLQGDEWKAAATIEAVRAGNWSFSEIYIVEHRDAPWPYPRLPYWICGVLATVVGGTPTLFILTDFLIPPVLFMLFYLVLCRLGVRRSISLWVGVLYVLHHADLYALVGPVSRRGLVETLRWFARPFHLGAFFSEDSYAVTRFPFPLMSLTIVMAFLLTLYPALKHGRRWAVALAGLLLGIITYLRFFDWMILYPALAIAVGLTLWRKDRQRAVVLAVIIGIGIVIASPYLLGAVGQSGDPKFAATLEHGGLEQTHRIFPLPLRQSYPAGPLCLLALLIACPFVGTRTPGRLAFVAIVLGFVPACFYQIVTGWTVVPDHWYRDHIFPFFTAAAGLGFGLMLFRLLKERHARGALMVATGLALAHALTVHVWYAEPRHPDLAEVRRALAEVPEDGVVLSLFPEEVKVAGPHTWTFLTCAPWSPIATDELLERYLIALKLYGVKDSSDHRFQRLFGSGQNDHLWGLVGGEEFAHYSEPSGLTLGGFTGVYLPAESLARWTPFFDALPDDPTALVAHIRSTRRIDYLMVTDRERDLGEPPGASGWQAVFQGESVTLYRLE